MQLGVPTLRQSLKDRLSASAGRKARLAWSLQAPCLLVQIRTTCCTKDKALFGPIYSTSKKLVRLLRVFNALQAALVHRRMAMLYELIPSNHTVEKCVPRHDVLMPKRLPWMPRFAKHRVLRRKVEARRSKVKNKKSLKNATTCFTCHFFASS